MLQKGVVRLIMNSSGMLCVVKAFHTLRDYVNLRKRFKKYANMVNCYLNRYDIVQPFQQWKSYVKQCRETENLLSKEEIHERFLYIK